MREKERVESLIKGGLPPGGKGGVGTAEGDEIVRFRIDRNNILKKIGYELLLES